jgi:gliding motility-associated-like protein
MTVLICRKNTRTITKMKRLTYILISILLFFATKSAAQPCTSVISGGTPTICYNTTPGILTATLSGDLGPFTYLWFKDGISTGVTTSTYDPGNLSATTTFYCNMTGTTCVTTTSSIVTITVYPVLTAAISGGLTPICFNTTPGTLTATGGGGTGAYTYMWFKDGVSTGFTAPTYNPGNLTATSSFYCVITSGSCGTANTAIKTITVDPVFTASISGGNSPICANTSPGTLTATGVGGAGVYTYLWIKDGIPTTTTTQTYNPGSLTVSSSFFCSVTSGTCSTVNTSTTSITVTPAPSAIISYTGSPWCTTGGVQNVTLVGTTGGTFSAPGGLSIDATSGAITTSTSSAGTYTVAYTIAASGGCGNTTASTSVTISPTPSAPIIGTVTQTTCSVATGSVTINGLPATGNWILTRNPGSITTAGSGPSIILTGIPVGTHTFTVTNIDGCISPASTALVINIQPASPTSPVSSVNCSLGFGNGIVTVTSPVGAGLEYSLAGGPFQTSNIFNAVANNSYFVSVRNAAGCTTNGSVFAVSCGCINPPTLTLASTTGNTCGITPVTVTGNSFGGSATSVTLSDNGAGNVTPASANTSPFSFTYTPTAADAGKNVIITITTNNPVGGLCIPAVSTYTLTVYAAPASPAIGAITNLTCTVGTGSVVLTGLPPTGTWTLVRNPGAISTSGNGAVTTITGLGAGTFTFIVTSADGCTSPASADAVIAPAPSAPTAPVVGSITQPTCAISTGGVVLSGLPATGTWTLTRNPGGVTISGTGVSSTITALPSGTYTFSVTNSTGCVSPPSGNVIINSQPPIPPAPAVGTITAPSCSITTGSVLLNGLPATGTWTLIRYPGTISTTGTGISTTIAGLTLGTYNFTVTTADGCLSVASLNVIIPAPPAIPPAPTIGTITQPTFAVPSGSVVLNGLPSGSWVITRLPGAVTTAGTGTSRTISNLAGGVFTFTVTNSTGCTSTESNSVTISTPGTPSVVITDPAIVCSPATVDLTNPAIIAGSTAGLTYTYWKDAGATITYGTPAAATNGTYFIKGTTVSGYFSIKPVNVKIDQLPVPNAGLDQTLYYQFSTTLDATLAVGQTGVWSFISGSATFADNKDPKTMASDLLRGDNKLLWTVTKGVCPPVSDTVNIIVSDLIIPTLITPNMDGRNDFFVVRGLTQLGKTELVIFDRRGAEVFRNKNYDNLWNGVDYNKKPLPDDTYFYIIKSENGKSFSGYIVIRR